MNINPNAAINVLRKNKSRISLTQDESRVFGKMVMEYNLMWSPPCFRHPGDRLPQTFVDTMRSLAVNNVVAELHTNTLGPLDIGGPHIRLVSLVVPDKAKPLARMGATCICGPLYAGRHGITQRSYPLAQGYLGYWDGYFYQHDADGQLYHVDVAYQHNANIPDVDAGIQFLERNMAQLGRPNPRN